MTQERLSWSFQQRSLSEADYQRALEQALRTSGWLVMHVRRLQGRDGRWLTGTSHAGYPDLTAIHPPTGRLLVLEVKKMGGRPTPAQLQWIEAFQQVPGCHAEVCDPRDYSRLLDLIRRPEASTAP